MKTCVRCDVEFPAGIGRPASRCAPCRVDHRKEYDRKRGSLRADTPAARSERVWTYRIKSQYGITAEAYAEMLAAQGGVCAVCAGAPTKKLAIDHDHSCCAHDGSCGKCVRGLVCFNCNAAMGQMRDNPERLRAAAAYLEAHRGN